jgi:pilus assembly protein Flp/PilA
VALFLVKPQEARARRITLVELLVRKTTMPQNIVRFIESEDGATAIEYGLIALLISTVIVASTRSIGLTLNSVFTQVNAGFK